MTIPCTAILITNRFDDQCRRAIDSLQNFEEILIFDSTRSILKSDLELAQAKIIPLPTEPITDFSKVRNNALEQAHFDWVFFLDSDEILQPFSAEKLAQTLKTTTAHGFECTRSDFFHGKQLHYGEAGSQKLVRLVHAPHTQFVGAVHEKAKITGEAEKSDLIIHHFSHASIAEFLTDVTLYASRIGSEKKFSLFELLLYPPAKFMVQFIFKAGFLDGYRGLTYALIMSIHSIIVRATAYEKNHV